MASNELDKLFEYVDSNQAKSIARLSELVALKSVASDVQSQIRIVNTVKGILESYGASCELKSITSNSSNTQTSDNCRPILLATLGKDSAKRTILVYGHLDVCPAFKEDGWLTEPFCLVKQENNLCGRGATDNKGPIAAWLTVVEAYQSTATPLPVNLKFCFSTVEESEPVSFHEFLFASRHSEFFAKIDYVCISSSCWLGEHKPCLTYGFRGYCNFGIEIECADRYLFSDEYGGTVHEAMADLVWLMARLVDVNNNILIPGIMTNVLPLTDEEAQTYKDIDFSLDNLQQKLGSYALASRTTIQCLQSLWRQPSLSIHGVEGAFYGSGTEIFIPGKVIGKFSIRLVPSQTPESIQKLVSAYLNRIWNERKSPNRFRLVLYSSGSPWILDSADPHLQAATRAAKKVYGTQPDKIREGGHFAAASALAKATGKSMIIMPIGQSTDGAHEVNEKISELNFINGTKLFIAYLDEMSKISRK